MTVVSSAKGDKKQADENAPQDVASILAEMNKMREEMEALRSQTGNTPTGMAELAQAIHSLVNNNSEPKSTARLTASPVMEYEIDPDDFLDEPVLFFKFSHSHTIFDDVRFNKPIFTPYKTPIKFHNSQYSVKQGPTRFDQSTIAICTARVRSKKEVEWLRKHSEYNVTFFEEIQKAQSMNSVLAAKLVQANNMCMNMTQSEVIHRAKIEGIQISKDVDQMKRDLVQSLAKKMAGIAGVRTMPTASLNEDFDTVFKRVAEAPSV